MPDMNAQPQESQELDSSQRKKDLQIELMRRLDQLPNRFEQISSEDIDHINEISPQEARRQLKLTTAAMSLFANLEKILPIGPIASKKLGGFVKADTKKSEDQK